MPLTRYLALSEFFEIDSVRHASLSGIDGLIRKSLIKEKIALTIIVLSDRFSSKVLMPRGSIPLCIPPKQ